MGDTFSPHETIMNIINIINWLEERTDECNDGRLVDMYIEATKQQLAYLSQATEKMITQTMSNE